MLKYSWDDKLDWEISMIEKNDNMLPGSADRYQVKAISLSADLSSSS